MQEYETREKAERDPNLNLMIIWTCDQCGDEREEYPCCNKGGQCECGGNWHQTGESYNA